MFALALAAAIAASQPWQPQSGVTAQATASVRIVAGERIRFGAFSAAPDRPRPQLRKTTLQLDGSEQPAWLVEFP